MDSNTAIVPTSVANFIAPVVDVQAAITRYRNMRDFIDSVLRLNVDYGKVPGTDKNTLLKPGAEKLATFFGLSPKFEIVEKELDWLGNNHGGEQFFYFHYRCILLRGDILAAEGEGSASSWEKKYRYRNGERVCPQCGKPTIIKGKAEYGGGFICFAKKGGCGAKFKENDQEIIGQQVGQVKNPDAADIVNTLQKMAQKRAYVAAVLLAVNGSEYFTQDVEDFVPDDVIDAQFHDAPPTTNGKPQAATKPAQAQPPAQQIGSPINGGRIADDQPTEWMLKQWHLYATEAESYGIEFVPIDPMTITKVQLAERGKQLKALIDEAAKATDDAMVEPQQPA